MQKRSGLRGYVLLLGFMIVLFLGLSAARAWAIPEPEGLELGQATEDEALGWRLVLHRPDGERQEYWLAEVFADSTGYEWNLGQPYLPLRLLAEAGGMPLGWQEYQVGRVHSGAAIWTEAQGFVLLLPGRQQLIKVGVDGQAIIQQEYAAPLLLEDTLCLPLALLEPLGLSWQLQSEQRLVEVWLPELPEWSGGEAAEPGGENGLDMAAAWQLAQPKLAEIWAVEAEAELLAAAETSFNAAQRNRSQNIYLAAEALHGLQLAPGEEFSFNAAVGPRTAERGFLSAIIFVDRQPVQGLGGGICQVSSTLYLALRQTKLSVLERHPHSLAVDYAPAGGDATVAWGSKDLRWQNNLEQSVYLLCRIGGGRLRIEIWQGEAPAELPALFILE